MDEDRPLSEQVAVVVGRQHGLSDEVGRGLVICEVIGYIINGAAGKGKRREVRVEQDRHLQTRLWSIFWQTVSNPLPSLYKEFISPFEEDQQKPHPLCTETPEGFTTF